MNSEERISLHEYPLIELPSVRDARGTLGFAETHRHVPFDIRRIFYITGVPTGTRRGGHAHLGCQQFLICLAGRVRVRLSDGRHEQTLLLEQPAQGLYVAPMTWADLEFTEPETCVLVLASEHYDEADYVRDRTAFEKIVSEIA